MRRKLGSDCTFSKSRDRTLRFKCTIREGAAAGAQRGSCAVATARSSPSLPLTVGQVRGPHRRPTGCGVPLRHRPKRRRHLNGNRPPCSDSRSRPRLRAIRDRVGALSSPGVRVDRSGQTTARRSRAARVAEWRHLESAVAATATRTTRRCCGRRFLSRRSSSLPRGVSEGRHVAGRRRKGRRACVFLVVSHERQRFSSGCMMLCAAACKATSHSNRG